MQPIAEAQAKFEQFSGRPRRGRPVSYRGARAANIMRKSSTIAGRRAVAALAALAAAGGVGCSGGPSETVPLQDPVVTEQSEPLRSEANRHAIATELFGRDHLIHGIAGDSRLVFVTEPLYGRVAVHDRYTGQEIALVPPPSDGWILPFAMRIVDEGRLVVLDAGGFPNPGVLSIPRVYDYDYVFDRSSRTLTMSLVRTVKFDSVPVGFTEDVELLPDGSYVVSDSILGALWLVLPDGTISPGIVPETFDRFLPELALCTFEGTTPIVDGIPFAIAGNFAPGVGSMATDGAHLYYGNSCLGGIHRVPLASLSDATRLPHERADDAEVVSPGVPGTFEVMKGLTFNRWHSQDRRLYVLEALRLRLLRVDVTTGAREVLAEDPMLFNLPVASAFLPSSPGLQTLVVASDQEHRFAGINQAISTDLFQPPFLVTKVLVTD